MFDTIFGLPVHVLVIHVALALVPVSSVVAILVGLFPHWPDRARYAVLVLASAGVAAVWVAIQSGQELKERLQAGGIVARQIQRHQDAGELALWFVLAVWVLAVVLVILSRRPYSRAASRSVAALMLIAGTAATGQVLWTGHLGATAVWSCTISSSACQ